MSRAVTDSRIAPALGMGAMIAAIATVLTGCSLFGPSGDTPEASESSEGATAPSVPKSVSKVLAAVKPLAAKDKQPTAKSFFSAMAKAGYRKSALEFSIDTTPLDTGVSAKMFGVRVSDGCVIGEIRDGKASAQLAQPSASTGSCMLGKVQRPAGVSEPSGRARPADQTGPTGLPGEQDGGDSGSISGR